MLFPLLWLPGRLIHKTINATAGLKFDVPPGKIWWVMNGNFYHVNGTQTTWYVYHAGTAGGAKTTLLGDIPSGVPSYVYPIGTVVNEYTVGAGTQWLPHASWSPILLNGTFWIELVGGAGVSAELIIWEMEEGAVK